jgi:hypothetical protein
LFVIWVGVYDSPYRDKKVVSVRAFFVRTICLSHPDAEGLIIV